MVQILNPEIYQTAKSEADKIYSKPSAYKSGWIVKRYKELGGKYKDDKKPKNLDRWFKENWKDIAGLDYPVYRPTKKVSKKTPLIPSEIDPKSLVEQSILKQVIKGKKNLPPFKAKGGKRTAKEIKDFLDASYQDHPPSNLDGFVLDKKLSTDTAKVYYNPQTKEAVVAHRGTKGTADWANNLAYALGAYEYTPRYKKGKSVQDKAERKYGKENISTLGHSQGAILSRKLGSDTKEVINVNPAWLGEKPKKNEYTIRSKSDIVSGLYAPISKARSILYPKYTKKHDINISPKSTTDILGEHSYDILNRLGNQEIGVGAENKISNNNMKGGRKFSLDEKIKQLVYLGIPQPAVALLLQTGSLETIWDTWVSGGDIQPLLIQVLDSVDTRQSKRSVFDLNVQDSGKLGDDEDPLQEAQVSEPVNVTDEDLPVLSGGMRVAYANVGTNRYGVKGGKVNIGKAFKNLGKKISKTFKPVGKAIDEGMAKASQATIGQAFGNKGFQKVGASLGDITNDYLLPAVVSAGKPIYDATAMTASTMLTGNPVLGKAVGDTLWNEMVAKKGVDPRQNQKSQVLGELSETTGKAVAKPFSASLGGKGRKGMKGGNRQQTLLNKVYQYTQTIENLLDQPNLQGSPADFTILNHFLDEMSDIYLDVLEDTQPTPSHVLLDIERGLLKVSRAFNRILNATWPPHAGGRENGKGMKGGNRQQTLLNTVFHYTQTIENLLNHPELHGSQADLNLITNFFNNFSDIYIDTLEDTQPVPAFVLQHIESDLNKVYNALIRIIRATWPPHAGGRENGKGMKGGDRQDDLLVRLDNILHIANNFIQDTTLQGDMEDFGLLQYFVNMLAQQFGTQLAQQNLTEEQLEFIDSEISDVEDAGFRIWHLNFGAKGATEGAGRMLGGTRQQDLINFIIHLDQLINEMLDVGDLEGDEGDIAILQHFVDGTSNAYINLLMIPDLGETEMDETEDTLAGVEESFWNIWGLNFGAQGEGAGRKKKSKKIDFEELRWGTFERMFHDFKRENPKARVKDLHAFAKRILKNKSKFSKRAIQKANFYINIIEKK